MLRKVKFYKHLFLSANSMLYNVLNFAMVHNYSGDDMLLTVFMPQCLAVDLVYHLFQDNVAYITVCMFISLFRFYLYLFSFFFFFYCDFMFYCFNVTFVKKTCS